MIRTLFALALLLPLGCGGGSGTLSGTVAYKGRKLTQGSVSVVSASGATASAAINPDGTYTIENCPGGNLKIAVNSPDPNEMARRAAEMKASGRASGQTAGFTTGTTADPASWFAIPAAYGDPDTSGLSVDVSGNTVHPIELQ